MENEFRGIAPKELVFGHKEGLPGQVFAAEILTRPIVLRRSGGVLEIHIDRRGVKNAVYTTEGKNLLCSETLQGDRLETARRLDEDIHAFMVEAVDDSWLEIPVPEIPLRWASGGVLPVVTWRGDVWSPFFFRDISPVGWNIAAGSSETEAELCRPVSFGLREFVEETIVLPQRPHPGSELRAKTFPNIMKDDKAQLRAALNTVNRHLDIRSREDGITLLPFPVDKVPSDRAIKASFVPMKTRLHIKSESGNEELSDVLVCFNLLELGIEVISVIRYELRHDDYLLDGETLTPVGGKAELIRMPVAMISHTYLEQVFGCQPARLDYHRPPLIDYSVEADVWKQVRAGQPSVSPARPPVPGEIVVFGWDVDRRAELAGAGSLDGVGWKADPMRIRHRKWGKTFARYFELDDSIAAPRQAYPYFTAGSAKTIAYYFSQGRGNVTQTGSESE
jgi:hypothetical protein